MDCVLTQPPSHPANQPCSYIATNLYPEEKPEVLLCDQVQNHLVCCDIFKDCISVELKIKAAIKLLYTIVTNSKLYWLQKSLAFPFP